MDHSRDEYLAGMLDRTLRAFSPEEVEKVRATTFAVSGLGGVGAITAELLARWGVRRFRLLDMDCYEHSNLNRQLFATSRTIGRPKAEVTAERIREINPWAEIEMIVTERVTNENVEHFYRGAGMALQNADHPSCKLFYNTARKLRMPLVNGHATVSGGRVQLFNFRDSACDSLLVRLWQRLKMQGEKPLESMTKAEIADFDRRYVHPTAASVNFVVNMVGCCIVAEAVKFLTGRGKVAAWPRYMAFDTFDWRMRVHNELSPLAPENLDRLRRLAGMRKNA